MVQYKRKNRLPEKLLPLVRLAEDKEKGLPILPQRWSSRKNDRRWFTPDRELTLLGRAHLWKIRQMMPFLFR